MSPSEFENKVKEKLIVQGLIVKGIYLMELLKEISVVNIINSKVFEMEVQDEFVASSLVIEEVLGDSIIKLPKRVSAVLKEFQDNCPFKIPNSSPYMLDIYYVRNLEQYTKFLESLPFICDKKIRMSITHEVMSELYPLGIQKVFISFHTPIHMMFMVTTLGCLYVFFMCLFTLACLSRLSILHAGFMICMLRL